MNIPVVLTMENPSAIMPTYANQTDAAFDLYANLGGDGNFITIAPGETVKISVGFAIDMPSDYYMAIVPRSGISAKTHLTLPNSPGTIDPAYRDIVKVILRNDCAALSVTPTDALIGGPLFTQNTGVVAELNKADGSLCNSKGISYIINHGDRIAQGMLLPRHIVQFVEQRDPDFVYTNDDRGGGFGSSKV